MHVEELKYVTIAGERPSEVKYVTFDYYCFCFNQSVNSFVDHTFMVDAHRLRFGI